MAGAKGRSGGPRKNAGGKRPGAGRKPKFAPKAPPKRARRRQVAELTTAQEAIIGSNLPNAPGFVPPVAAVVPSVPVQPDLPGITDAKAFLEGVIGGTIKATADQIRAAQALLPFQHKKLGETGKKESQKDAAGQAAGRFTPAPPPRLASVAGKRV